MLSKNTSYVSRLDHLRFFAALLVITYHFGAGVQAKDDLNPFAVLIKTGETGVGLFMVLSGFILTRISLGKLIDYKSFMFNRVVRIYPLYVFAIFVAAYTGGRHMDFLSIVALLSTIGIVANVALTKFQQVWTIAVEFQFYLLFPFLLRFMDRYGTKYIVGLIAFVVITRGMMFVSDGSIKDAAYWTIVGRIDQFCVGMLAAKVFADRRKFFSSPVALALAGGVVYLWLLTWHQWTGGYAGPDTQAGGAWIIAPTLEALAWALFALAYMQQNWPMNRIVDKTLSFLGSISFSLYVWHFPILVAANKLPFLFHFQGWYWNLLLVLLPIMVTISSLSYFLIEKPFFSLRRVYTAEPNTAS